MKTNYVNAIKAYSQMSADIDHLSATMPEDILEIKKLDNENNIVQKDQISSVIPTLKRGDTIKPADVKSVNTKLHQGTLNPIAHWAKEKVDLISKSEIITQKAINDEASLIQVTHAVNEAEVALQQVIAIRDKTIGAWMEILKLPL